MEQEQSQAQPNEEMTPEEAKASLGLSTRLTEQFLISQVPQGQEEGMQEQPTEAPVEPETAPEQ